MFQTIMYYTKCQKRHYKRGLKRAQRRIAEEREETAAAAMCDCYICETCDWSDSNRMLSGRAWSAPNVIYDMCDWSDYREELAAEMQLERDQDAAYM